MASGMGEKTEDPTPRKLRKAREEGDAGVSVFAAQAVGFLVAVAVMTWPVGIDAARIAVKPAWPLASVVTLAEPTNVRP